jgi:hypothetical protein
VKQLVLDVELRLLDVWSIPAGGTQWRIERLQGRQAVLRGASLAPAGPAST